MAIALDTLAYARRLREAGFTEAQAEGQAEALAAAMTDTLATKQDLREFEIRMTEFERRVELRFSEQTAHLDGKLADLERRMTMRLGSVTVAAVGTVAALVKLISAT